jgi:hypothetical protein
MGLEYKVKDKDMDDIQNMLKNVTTHGVVVKEVSDITSNLFNAIIPNKRKNLEDESIMLDIMQKRKNLNLPLDERGLNKGSFPLMSLATAGSVLKRSAKVGPLASVLGDFAKSAYKSGPLG